MSVFPRARTVVLGIFLFLAAGVLISCVMNLTQIIASVLSVLAVAFVAAAGILIWFDECVRMRRKFLS